MSASKLVASYLCLVGLPLLGLLGILRAGKRLHAPLSVGGAWTLQADFSSVRDEPCRSLLSGISEPFVSVFQSGSKLTLTLNNPQQTTLAGSLRGATLATAAPPTFVLSERACTDPRSIYLQAEVSGQAAQRTLTGTMGIQGCASCAPVPFRAVRQASSTRELP